ncbi:Tn3 family transposase [Streptomyces sp. NPDC054783]
MSDLPGDRGAGPGGPLAFICDYLADVELRQGIDDGLQVVENRNFANHDLFYGEDGDLTGADEESQEVGMPALHLLQSALVHANTLLMRQVLAEPKRAGRLTEADRRALSPQFWSRGRTGGPRAR